MKLKTTLLVSSLLVCGFACAQNQVQAKATLGNSMEFIPNKGQFIDTKGNARPDILYVSNDGGVTVFLRNTGFSYVVNTLRDPRLMPGYVDNDDDDDDNKGIRKPKKDTSRTCRLDMDFVGASVTAIQNSSPTEGCLNYYLPQWH